MAFGQPSYTYYNAAPNYQIAAYSQPMPSYQPRQEQPITFPQPGVIPARYVTGREEAVAAQINPGDPNIYADFAHGRMYVKQINPQTMAADFAEFVRVQPVQQSIDIQPQTQAQFATQADLDALREELESLRASIAPRQTNRKAVSSDE